jgi:hypothetical protein
MHFSSYIALAIVALAGQALAQDANATASAAPTAITITSTQVDFPLETTSAPQVVVTDFTTTTVQANQSGTITQTIANTVTESLSVTAATETLAATNTEVNAGSTSTAQVTATITQFAPAPVITETLNVTETQIISDGVTSTVFGSGNTAGGAVAGVPAPAQPTESFIPDDNTSSALRNRAFLFRFLF